MASKINKNLIKRTARVYLNDLNVGKFLIVREFLGQCEDLKKVKQGKRGTFSRLFNRRLSHWLYRTLVQLLERKCEEEGIQLVVKDPFKTSQFCSICNRWDRLNRKGDRFRCVHCGYLAHADHNAAHNLELLGVAGVYGLRSYLSSKS